jgi:YD repeat-containing protein
VRLSTAKQFDNLDRLSWIWNGASSAAGTVVASSHVYAYNSANQRTSATLRDGSYWVYQYDTLGQVISGKKYWSDGTPVAGQQFEYGHDDIGNRTSAKAGGDQAGGNLRVATYTPNNLNQPDSAGSGRYPGHWPYRSFCDGQQPGCLSPGRVLSSGAGGEQQRRAGLSVGDGHGHPGLEHKPEREPFSACRDRELQLRPGREHDRGRAVELHLGR